MHEAQVLAVGVDLAGDGAHAAVLGDDQRAKRVWIEVVFIAASPHA